MGVILVPMPIADAGHLAANIFYYFFSQVPGWD